MRRKARQGTAQVRRTLGNRSLRIGIGLAVLFVFGLMASGAFGDTFSVITTSTATTPGNSASTTDTTSAPSDSSSTATDISSSSTATTTTATAAPVPYIATFKSGVSDAQQQADIAAANGTPGDAIAVLHMDSLTFPAGEDSTDAQTLAANPDVASLTPDLSRATAAQARRPVRVQVDTASALACPGRARSGSAPFSQTRLRLSGAGVAHPRCGAVPSSRTRA